MRHSPGASAAYSRRQRTGSLKGAALPRAGGMGEASPVTPRFFGGTGLGRHLIRLS